MLRGSNFNLLSMGGISLGAQGAGGSLTVANDVNGIRLLLRLIAYQLAGIE